MFFGNEIRFLSIGWHRFHAQKCIQFHNGNQEEKKRLNNICIRFVKRFILIFLAFIYRTFFRLNEWWWSVVTIISKLFPQVFPYMGTCNATIRCGCSLFANYKTDHSFLVRSFSRVRSPPLRWLLLHFLTYWRQSPCHWYLNQCNKRNSLSCTTVHCCK